MTKYQRIKDQLLSEISTGAYAFGESLPSEHALAQRFQVSRMTARRALSQLEQEGYLLRTPGRGSILKKPQFSQGFLNIKAFRSYAQDLGATAKTQVLAAKAVRPDAVTQERLGVRRAVFVHRLRSLDDRVVLEEKRFLNYELCSSILKEDLEQESIHELLINKLNLPLTKVWQRLSVSLLTEEQASRFECQTPMPGFVLERLTYTLKQPVTWVTYLMRGDVYSFETEFQPQEGQHVGLHNSSSS